MKCVMKRGCRLVLCQELIVMRIPKTFASVLDSGLTLPEANTVSATELM